MSTDVTDVLRSTDLLGSASAADLEAIAAASRSRTFRRGQILFTAGDPGNTLIVVISGRVKVVVRSADGGELTLTVIAPGGVFGELSVADGGSRSADAEALEECRLLFVPREVIMDLCGRAPSVAQALASSLAARTRATRPGSLSRAPVTGERDAAEPAPAEPAAGQADEGAGQDHLAKVIPLGNFDPFAEADKRW